MNKRIQFFLSEVEGIINEYPEFGGFDTTEQTNLTVSAVYVNIKSIRRYLENIKVGAQAGAVEYHLQNVEEMLQELKNQTSDSNILQNFIQKEQKKLNDLVLNFIRRFPVIYFTFNKILNSY